MLSFALLLAAFFVSHAAASPVDVQGLRIPHLDPQQILCQLPILKKFLCPPTGVSALNRQTPLGLAKGTLDPDGAYRFVVKYADAQRWKPSTLVSSWNLPSGVPNVTAMPPACPQPFVDDSVFDEDCLSVILYVPPTLTLTSAAPTFMWIHGGSFIMGSASAAGLDGSKLAIQTNSIVAVIQYRLGAFGFIAPDGTTNLGVKDAVNALKFLQKVVPAFGGSASKVTIAGQSSGGTMIRALLAAPSASSLFRSAIIQSDPMNFGFLSPSTQQALQSSFLGLIGCDASDTSCQNSLSLDDILNAEVSVFLGAPNFAPAAGSAQPMRPVFDGSFITSPLDSTAPFPSVSKPLIITTVAHEAALAIYGSQDPYPINQTELADQCVSTFGAQRAATVLASPFYQPVPADGGDGRVQLQLIGTDYLWRCSSWTFARNWVQNGGSVYVGEYVVGASYPGNDAVEICTQPGIVCHQDDIEIVFGTTPSPSTAQSTLTDQMQKRYKAFLANGNPNTSGVPTWTAAASSDVHPLVLGGSGVVAVGACTPSFWGSDVQFDYQFFNA